MIEVIKGSASIGVPRLKTSGAVRQVWVPSNRKDRSETVGDMAPVFRNIYLEIFKHRVSATRKALGSMLSDLEDDQKHGDMAIRKENFCPTRVKKLMRFQERISTASR